jgi:hypothetical protein
MKSRSSDDVLLESDCGAGLLRSERGGEEPFNSFEKYSLIFNLLRDEMR